MKRIVFILFAVFQCSLILANETENWPMLHRHIVNGESQKALDILSKDFSQAFVKTPSIKLVYHHMGHDPDSDYDVYFADEEGILPIELAAKMNDEKIVEALILLGANPNVKRKECCSGINTYWEVRGGRLYQQNKWNEPRFWDNGVHQKIITPLYWAILKGNKTLVRRFLQCACDTNLVYSKNELIMHEFPWTEGAEQYNAIELATKLGHTEIVALLLGFNWPDAK